MSDAQCIAIIAALYQAADAFTQRQDWIDNAEAVEMAQGLLRAARLAVSNG